jgi:folate-binding protein YgfZ
MTAMPTMDENSIDAGVAWHYGDPFREQKALAAGTGRVDLSHRGVITVTGADRHTWLHSLTTADFRDPFTSLQALILSPQGHIEHDLHVIDDGSTTWIIVEPNTVSELVRYLTMMKFMLQVQVADVTPEFAVVGAPGHLTSSHPTWHSPPSLVLDSGVTDFYVPERPGSWQVSELIVPREDLAAELADELAVGTWAWEAHRIRAGVPRLHLDIDTRTIPHEVGLISAAVHLNKGCYRGQETVAKVYNLGKPPRRLVQLLLDGSTNEVPELGASITFGEKVVGALTSVVQDYELGPVGLGVIKRTVPLEAVLDVSGIAASQVPVVV